MALDTFNVQATDNGDGTVDLSYQSVGRTIYLPGMLQERWDDTDENLNRKITERCKQLGVDPADAAAVTASINSAPFQI